MVDKPPSFDDIWSFIAERGCYFITGAGCDDNGHYFASLALVDVGGQEEAQALADAFRNVMLEEMAKRGQVPASSSEDVFGKIPEAPTKH